MCHFKDRARESSKQLWYSITLKSMSPAEKRRRPHVRVTNMEMLPSVQGSMLDSPQLQVITVVKRQHQKHRPCFSMVSAVTINHDKGTTNRPTNYC